MVRPVPLFLLFVVSALAQEADLDRAARLDSEHECVAAEQLYRKMLAGGKPSAALLNNAGNHYVACGGPAKARGFFEQVLSGNPTHVNARLQLAKLAVARKQGAVALDYLAPLGKIDPEVLLTRAEALHEVGRAREALVILDGVMGRVPADPAVLFAAGLGAARMGEFVRAERAFGAALELVPDDVDVLYNAGLASARAGHMREASRRFEAVLAAKPGNVDALYELGRLESTPQTASHAVFVLAQARKLAGQRADIVLALARASQMAGYYGDARVAYEDYLKLRPGDEIVRRDLAFLRGFEKGGVRTSIGELTAYVARHPRDAVGLYDLARLYDRTEDRARALELAATAVRVDPKFAPARYFRAWLLAQLGRTGESLEEARAAVRLTSDDAAALDLVGLDYLTLQKPAEAEPFLRKALAVAPEDAATLFHLGRALMELGRAEEAKPLIERFQKAREAAPRMVLEQPAMIEAASLPAGERSRRVVEQLRELVGQKQGDLALRVDLGTALLEAGRTEEGAGVFRELLEARPGSDVSLRAGRALLRFQLYEEARGFLDRALPEGYLDLAIALYFSGHAEQAKEALDHVAADSGTGDALVLRAQLESSSETLSQAVALRIERPAMAHLAALMLLREGRAAKALEVIDVASPDGDLMLARVAALTKLGRAAQAMAVVRRMESQWPGWDRPFVVEALLTGTDKLGITAAARCVVEKPDRKCECGLQEEESLIAGCR